MGHFLQWYCGIQADSKPGRKTGLAQVAEYKIVLEKYFLIFPLNNFLLGCYSNYFLVEY